MLLVASEQICKLKNREPPSSDKQYDVFYCDNIVDDDNKLLLLQPYIEIEIVSIDIISFTYLFLIKTKN